MEAGQCVHSVDRLGQTLFCAAPALSCPSLPCLSTNLRTNFSDGVHVNWRKRREIHEVNIEHSVPYSLLQEIGWVKDKDKRLSS